MDTTNAFISATTAILEAALIGKTTIKTSTRLFSSSGKTTWLSRGAMLSVIGSSSKRDKGMVIQLPCKSLATLNPPLATSLRKSRKQASPPAVPSLKLIQRKSVFLENLGDSGRKESTVMQPR